MKLEVSIVGLGLLGSALAEVVRAGGFSVIGWDCQAQARERNAQQGVGIAASLEEAVADRPWVVLSLPTSREVRDVLAEGRFRAGQIIVDTTTGDPDETEECAREAERLGVGYIDACVAGSSEAVRRRSAILLVGGEQTLVEKMRPLLDAVTDRFFHLGPPGSGARMKLVFNLMLGLERAALAEALAFAMALKIDPNVALDVLQTGATSCPAMHSKGPKMIRREYPPEARLAQHLKDVELILKQSVSRNAKVPLSALHRQLLAELIERGLGDDDNAAIIESFLDSR